MIEKIRFYPSFRQKIQLSSENRYYRVQWQPCLCSFSTLPQVLDYTCDILYIIDIVVRMHEGEYKRLTFNSRDLSEFSPNY